jgi:Fe-S-cluster-containing hydrogenase component 2
MTDRYVDLCKQGFMKMGRKEPKKVKHIEIVSCDKCHDWHEKGKHIKKLSNPMVKILNKAGYKTIEGYDNILNAINNVSDGTDESLCSGYGVFPNGIKCNGCKDCLRNNTEI